MSRLPFDLIVVTGAARDLPRFHERACAIAHAGGPRVALLVRDPVGTLEVLRERARCLRVACADSGARLLVHGDPAHAAMIGADGVHLPASFPSPAAARRLLGPDRLVGVSSHSFAELENMAAIASYATLSPVFASPGKGKGIGLAAFAAACTRSPLSVVALGGIDSHNAAACRAAGAAAVAVLRAVWDHADPAAATVALLRAMDERAPQPSSHCTGTGRA